MCERADNLIQHVQRVFTGVELDGGMGLQEAAGIDDYAGPQELERLNAADEKVDWRRIPPERLSQCFAAPSYLDAKGMRFHIPAFLVAELSGAIEEGFISRLIRYEVKGLPEILTPEQCEVINACMRFYAELYPDGCPEAAIASAQARFTRVEDAEPGVGADSR